MKWLKNFCGLRGYTLDKSRQLAYGNESGFAVLIQYQAEQPQYRITFGVREAEDGDGAGERLSEHLNALAAGNAFVNFASYKENLVTITLTGKAKKDPENLGMTLSATAMGSLLSPAAISAARTSRWVYTVSGASA